ncbi:hypothetical protein KHQ06_25160 [Nocardia tengchongensis]|uniref:Uncharacterized protein n=1 Tax=Nocardia tengchongensis TaxID=2055889 RepID=A0ABX8CI88_9NOCA|nr:hypothetical protein [Nocardia tengchongensis]QVI19640.1 hypothetical protein KHQ06_25160 [Nocardia tengchongensis]
MNWNAQGHAPTNLFGVPHFDFHFYMTDMAAQHAIDLTAVGYPRPRPMCRRRSMFRRII